MAIPVIDGFKGELCLDLLVKKADLRDALMILDNNSAKNIYHASISKRGFYYIKVVGLNIRKAEILRILFQKEGIKSY